MTADVYRQLETRFARVAILRETLRVLGWDQATQMPAGGAAARAEQVATLQVMSQEILADPRTSDLLDAAELERANLSDWQQANLREMRRLWRHAAAVEPDLLAERARLGNLTEIVWRRARPANDFATLRPHLAAMVRTCRALAQAKAEAFGTSPYDALLDEYGPGETTARIDPLFDELTAYLPPLLERVLERQARRGPVQGPQGPFPVSVQTRIGRELAGRMGFNFNEGRLDVSTHPFCSGVPQDIRMTTRYDETFFVRSLMATIHETGHALYEAGLPLDWRYQPVGLARGAAVHESQSLIFEKIAGRSPEFLSWLAPVLQDAFGGTGWDVPTLTHLCSGVGRTLIRVEADEITYPLHVILRYRLERDLLDGRLDVADLPDAWRETMRSLIGVEPPDDRDGCMQDIHWTWGYFGYFPTYTLGAVMAAQMFEAAVAADASIRPALGRGDFAPLLGWLRREVHARASSLPAPELVVAATGRPLGLDAYKRHLESRYLETVPATA